VLPRAIALGALFACAAAVPLPARSANAPLDLRAAVQYALDHDPTVLNDRATVEQNEATFARDHAAEFPSLAGQVQNTLQKTNGNTSGTFSQFGLSQATVYSQNTAQILSSWTPYNGSLAQITAQQAKRQVEGARESLRRASQSLASDVATAWYAAVQDRDALRLAQGNRAYQQQLLDAAHAQEKVGRVAGVDVLRAQVDELRAESVLVSAQATDVNAREDLAQRIGAPPDTAFALPAELPEPPLQPMNLDAMVARALAGRGDVAAARAQVAFAQLADAAIESDRRPQLQVTGAFGNQETPAEQLAGLPPGFSRNSPGFWSIGATESFTLPLIEYGSRRAAHRAARAVLQADQAALASTIAQVTLDVRQAMRGVQSAYASVSFERAAAQAGAESARIAQLQYRNGLISLTDATSAQQSSQQAASDLTAARVNYLDALVHLNVAIGTADPLSVVSLGAP
jgi:outer membrane protein